MSGKGKKQVKVIVHDCFDAEIMRLEVSLKDKVKFIQETIQARDKDNPVYQQVLIHNDKVLKPKTTVSALLPKGWKNMETLPTVHLQMLIASMILQSATSQAEFRNDIKDTADLDLGRKIWGSGTGQERYPKAKGGEWNREDMVAKCTGHGPLLVLIQTDKGQMLGGYYPIKFQLSEVKGGWRRASKAFLFCVDPKFGWKTFPVKAPRADKAIWQQHEDCDVLFTFGEGDLCIYSNSFHNKTSYSALGGYHYGGGTSSDLLGQSSIYFRVKLIEVFVCKEAAKHEEEGIAKAQPVQVSSHSDKKTPIT